jgi:serine/threonine-protein kinase HipA
MAKKINVATINIWGNAVGAVAWDEKGFANFEYDKKFVKSKLEIAPLQMPLAEDEIYSFPSLNKETYKGLPGLLADSLPDAFGNKVIDAWLAREGRAKNDFSSIERLCYTGKRGMGALEFEPIILKKKKKESVPIEIASMVELANKILDDREKLNVELTEDEKKNKEAMEEIVSIGTSAGGARPKAVIAYNSTTGEVRSGQLSAPKDFEHWLLKFDGVSKKSLDLNDPLGFGKIEFTYYLMAKKAGINISECRLLKENGRSHFMTKRFDRENGENIVRYCSL